MGQRAQAAVALLRWTGPVTSSPSCDETRTYAFVPSWFSWLQARRRSRLLVRRFQDATDLSERRALLLSLGTMPPDQLPADERQPFLDRLLTVFQDEPDPGMHAAAEWLLRVGATEAGGTPRARVAQRAR